jgi:hypothetical protein
MDPTAGLAAVHPRRENPGTGLLEDSCFARIGVASATVLAPAIEAIVA